MSELFREGLRRLEEEDRGDGPRALSDLGTALRLIQESARATGLHTLSKREIDAEIEATRKVRSASGGRARGHAKG